MLLWWWLYFRSLRPVVSCQELVEGEDGSSRDRHFREIYLIIRARPWAATAMPGTRGACVVSADQAPHRARSMRARGGDIFNGVMSQMPLSCDYDT